jgi:site-specific DNA recombinase
VLRLHPNLPALYKNKVRQLAEALNEPATAVQAGEIMRGLIDRIVLTPGNGSFEGRALRQLGTADVLCRAEAQQSR